MIFLIIVILINTLAFVGNLYSMYLTQKEYKRYLRLCAEMNERIFKEFGI